MQSRTPITAVVFDLDGTAVPSGEHSVPSQAMIGAIIRAQPSLRLCAATGRSWEVARKVVRALRLGDPCIVSGGTQIIDPVNTQILWQATIQPASAQAIAAVMASRNYPFAYIRELEGQRSLDKFRPDDINIMYILDVPPAGEKAVMQELAQIPHITVSRALSWNLSDGVDLHITSNIATKEHAVYELAKIIGVPTAQMAGVGDGHNDIHLFNAVGHKVAMGNAAPELKAAADEIIGSIDEDGLAHYIEGLL